MTLPPVATTRSRRENRGNATTASSPYPSRSVPHHPPPPPCVPTTTPLPLRLWQAAQCWWGGWVQAWGPSPRPRRRGRSAAARPWHSPRAARRAAPPRPDRPDGGIRESGGLNPVDWWLNPDCERTGPAPRERKSTGGARVWKDARAAARLIHAEPVPPCTVGRYTNVIARKSTTSGHLSLKTAKCRLRPRGRSIVRH
jgi:hypothetical protein